MVNKKTLTRGGILLLAFIMLMPMGAFAAEKTVTVNSWNEYRTKIEENIKNQVENINIDFRNFEEGEIFNREYPIRLKIKEEFKGVIKSIPKHLGELNIKNVDGIEPQISVDEKSIKYNIEYNIDNSGFDVLSKEFDKEYINIRKKVTDYEKIKTAYDYIHKVLSDVDGEGDETIKELFSNRINAHTFLFAKMMTELGYENDIANKSGESYKWNLVKVQGKWYHVGYKNFLINLQDGNWDIGKHEDKICKDGNEYDVENQGFATEKYDGDQAEKLQIQYEIELIEKDVKNTSSEVDKVFKDKEITMGNVIEVKNEFKEIDGKLENYRVKKHVLKIRSEDIEESLEDKFVGLEKTIEDLSEKIDSRKKDIIDEAIKKAEETLEIEDILIAEEAVEMDADGNNVEKMDAFRIAIEAIEKASKTKLEIDINKAKEKIEDPNIINLKIKLENKIYILEVMIKVEKAEKTKLEIDINEAKALIEKLEDGDMKLNLGNRIEIVEASILVEKVEKNLKDDGITNIDELIDQAETSINSLGTGTIKEELEDRLNIVRSIVDTIELVDKIKSSIISLNLSDSESLSLSIQNFENDLETAEVQVKKIQDKHIRDNQEDRIKEIELVINAIKAVDKAETSEPLKMTNVKSAISTIEKTRDKLDKDYWEIRDDDLGIIGKLNDRLKTVEEKIAALSLESDAIKAVEKAEKSMKDRDVVLAKAAVALFATSEESVGIEDLNSRILAIDLMNRLENSLDKYFEEETDENRKKLDPAIGEARSAIKLIKEKELDIDSIITKYESRLEVASNARTAIDKIKEAEFALENEKDLAIIAAEEAIQEIKDSKIRKQLENKLKDIISQKKEEDKIKEGIKALEEAEDAVKKAKESLTGDPNEHKITVNIELVSTAEEKVKELVNGDDKKNLQAIIKELNNVIKAKQMVLDAENKLENGKLTLKDVKAIEKIVSSLNHEYRNHISGDSEENLDNRVLNLKTKLGEKEAAELLDKANVAVEKAEDTNQAKDIKTAKKAVDLVKDEEKRKELMDRLENLEVQMANVAVKTAEISAKFNNKSLSKDISTAVKLVELISNNKGEERIKLNNRIRALESYVSTIKVLQRAEKEINQVNIYAAEAEADRLKEIVEKIEEVDQNIYKEENGIIENIDARIAAINKHFQDENIKVKAAQDKVDFIRGQMKFDSDPKDMDILEAKRLVEKVTDKTIRADLQKDIDAIQTAKDAKLAVARAEAYVTEKSVKDAETALNKVSDMYSDIIENLGERIAELRNKLDISKKVEEATDLVQKAIESRVESDIIKAQFIVDDLETLAKGTYDTLTKILEELKESVENEAGDQQKALKAVKRALYGETDEEMDEEIGVFARLDEINMAIVMIIPNQEDEEKDIQDVYELIEAARNQIMIADAAVRRLRDKDQLLLEVEGAKEDLYLLEDKLNVKEAVRLTTLASASVNQGKDEAAKSKARLDIAAARRAIARINHKDNADEKKIISNTIDAIEDKLISDNDQELIDLAVEAVNHAADLLSKAVREENVIELQEELDKAIFSAEMAIGWISDKNKSAKDTLTGFINEIKSMYKAEKEGILNEERIKNAEEAVKKAEAKKGSDELESYIRSARLRIKIIRNDGPETELKINDLNTRLDILEGKSGGDSTDKSEDKKTDSSKSGGDSNTNKIHTTPHSSKNRFTEVNQPKWGRTKELKKKSPTIYLPKKK